jgi:hypothetical protein
MEEIGFSTPDITSGPRVSHHIKYVLEYSPKSTIHFVISLGMGIHFSVTYMSAELEKYFQCGRDELGTVDLENRL